MKRRNIGIIRGASNAQKDVAVDWSRVVAIIEHVDGTANLYFDYRTGEPPIDFRDWIGVGRSFQDVVDQWREWSEDPSDLQRAVLAVKRWMR